MKSVCGFGGLGGVIEGPCRVDFGTFSWRVKSSHCTNHLFLSRSRS